MIKKIKKFKSLSREPLYQKINSDLIFDIINSMMIRPMAKTEEEAEVCE
jgi:hypothetical protein